MNRRTVVVTGANGLLGRELLVQLAQTHDVRALVHRAPRDPIRSVQYEVVDFAVDWSLNALPETADAIVHLAQSAHFRDVPARALEVFQVNITATARLLDYAWRTGVQRFVFASSGGIYGNGTQPFRENSPISQPDSLGYYLGSKVSGEALVSSYAKFMKVMILRFFFIYGQRQNRTMLLPRLVDNIRTGQPVTIQGENGLRLNPIHVTDAAKAVVASLESESSAIYNIAGPEILSLRALCNEIASLVGSDALFQTAPGEPYDVVGDIGLMRAHLHEPTISPRVGIRDIVG
jgi:nucleoside-diphosphate-sugar epimerase